MRGRTIVSCMAIAGAALAVPAGSVAAPATPVAKAQAVRAWDVLAGNFAGDERAETFWYFSGGTNDDLLISSTNNGDPTGRLNETVYPFNVSRAYDPFASDFDGDGYDEIFWYGPGAAADSMWHFDDFTHPVSRSVNVRGTYQPLVGDFTGDGVDDVFWYAAGSAADSLWDFNAGGGYTATTLNVTGTYRPFVASIGKDATDDIFWYAPGAAADSVWDFTRGSTARTSIVIPVRGTYRPWSIDVYGDGRRSRSDDIMWYAPGATADSLWTYVGGVRTSANVHSLAGNWYPAVGDILGDGQEDVYLYDPAVGVTLRNYTTIDGNVVYVDYTTRFTTGTTAAATSVGDGPITASFAALFEDGERSVAAQVHDGH
jgi:hypothetical protein